MSTQQIQSGCASIAPANNDDTIESILTTAGISKAEQADILIDYIHYRFDFGLSIPKIGDDAALIRKHFAFWLLLAWTRAAGQDQTQEDAWEYTLGYSENTLKTLRSLTYANMKLMLDQDEQSREPDESIT